MPKITAQITCPLHDSFRVRQIAGLFDLALPSESTEQFSVDLPALDENWQIGVIVGPSGSGKSTIAHAAFPNALYSSHLWPPNRAVIDAFDTNLSIKQITTTLTSVGFSSPPGWLKPYQVLSNGEKFRCDLAMALLNPEPRTLNPLIAFDEFTSVVDRTVARIASAALSKSIRAGRIARRFVAITCHYDILPWLEPDWVLDMATGELARGRLHRPPIPLEIRRANTKAWSVFKRHHYLSAKLHPSAACFVGYVDGTPATVTAVIPFPHPKRPGYREHRTVCLPDFQGVGLGSAMSNFIASLYVATGEPYFSTTSHPALIRHRTRSRFWRTVRSPQLMTHPHAARSLSRSTSLHRLTASFEFVGPPRCCEAATFHIGCAQPFP